MRRVGNNIVLFETDMQYAGVHEDILTAIKEWAKDNPDKQLRMNATLEYQNEEHEVTANIMGVDASNYIIIDENPFDRDHVYYHYQMTYLETCKVNFAYNKEMSDEGSLLNIDMDYDKIWSVYYPIGGSGFNKAFQRHLENI